MVKTRFLCENFNEKFNEYVSKYFSIIFNNEHFDYN